MMGLEKWGLGSLWNRRLERRQQEALAKDKVDDDRMIALLKQKAKKPDPTPSERFNLAVRTGDLEAVRALLDQGMSPDLLLRGDLPTSEEIEGFAGIPDPVDGVAGWFLIPNVGGDARERTWLRYTPLMWAMATANLALADLLIERGATLSAVNDERRTALSVAAKAGSPKSLLWIVPRSTYIAWSKEDGDLSPSAWVHRHDPVLGEALDGLLPPPVSLKAIRPTLAPDSGASSSSEV